MRSIKWLLVCCAAGMGVDSLPAQSANPDQINQALELLRKGQTPATAATNLAPQTQVAQTNFSSDADVQRFLQKFQTSTPPATAITDPRSLREASQKAETAARARTNLGVRQPVFPEGQRPSSIAEEQALRARIELERQKEISRIEAEVNRIRQAQAQATNAPAAPVAAVPQTAPVTTPAPPSAIPAPQPQKPVLTAVPSPTPGTPPPTPSLTPEQERKARELLTQAIIERTSHAVTNATPAPKPVLTAAPSPTPATAAPAPVPGLTPEQERKARELLNKAIAQRTAQPATNATSAAPPPKPVLTAAPSPTPATAAPAPAPGLTPDQERKARELLNQTVVQRTTQPATNAAPAAPAPKPVLTAVPAAPSTAPGLTPEAESKARALLNQQINAIQAPAPAPARSTPGGLPIITVQTTAPATAPATSAPPAMLSPNMEKQARDILNQVIANTRDAQLPTLAMPPSTPAARSNAPAAPATVPPAAPKPAPAATAQPATPQPPPASPALTTEQEQKARELLNQTLSQRTPQPPQPPATTPVEPAKPAPAPAAPAIATTPSAPPSPAPAPAAPALTPEQERQARDLLDQMARTPAAPATPAPATPSPIMPATPAPVVPAPATPAPPAPPAVATTPPPVPQPTPAPIPTLTPEQERQARELLDQVARTPATPATPTPPAPSPATPATPAPVVPAPATPAAPTPPAVATMPAPAPQPTPAATPALTAEQERQARELLDKTLAQQPATPVLSPQAEAKRKRELERLDAESRTKAREEARKRLIAESKAAASAPPGTKKPESTKSTRLSAQTVSTTSPGANGVSASGRSKQQRLAELLDAYMKDQITPEQYHTQRAKIVAEP